MSYKLNHFIQYWLPVFVYAVLIFYLSSLPTIVQVDNNMLINKKFDINYIFHIFEYFIFSFLLFRAFSRSSYYKPMLLAILISIIYAATDEIHQLFVFGRSSSLLDMLFNGIGSVLAQSVILIKNNYNYKINFKST